MYFCYLIFCTYLSQVTAAAVLVWCFFTGDSSISNLFPLFAPLERAIMTSSNLEDQIEDYIFEHFNASQSAQHIFASYTESDVTKKLNDMASVQQAIESVLKQEVKKNYATFLSATEQIQQVGQEMTEFRQLIQNTQKLIAVSVLLLKVSR
jgi:hypothetical protein